MALMKSLFLCAGLLIAIIVAVSKDSTPQELKVVPAAPADTFSAAVFSMAEKYGCWTDGQTPTVDRPTHVLYFNKADGEIAVGDKELTDAALEQLYAGTDHGMLVYGLCP